jgi:vacuolar-type H+-ATPase subunit I/STV1
MKRVDRAVIVKAENSEEFKIILYQADWNYDDELEFYQIAEIDTDNFAIGCFEISAYPKEEEKEIQTIEKMIKDAEKEIDELSNSKWNEEGAIRHLKEYIEYLKEEKRKLEEAEETDEIVIDYSMCRLTIRYNGKSIEVEDDKELLFKNMKIKVEKF